ETGSIIEYPQAKDKFPEGNTLVDGFSVIVNSVWIILAPTTGKLWLLDLNNPLGGFVSRTTSGSPHGFIRKAGAVYHPASKAILVYHHEFGSKLRKLSVPDDPFSGNFVWSEVAPASGSAVPSGQDGAFQGVFS